CARKEDDFDYW
nr:immunoglobulin heavy chain junction region [Macaca mulatta]MOV89175.1 immunoglobulin heavy chain junction region [Macaca mulatta]MOV89534.1 immunoglobulin heavy chain junction region [Macaca mulatta]MOV90262.1 immunoglobulin heavy chain junction region [Macaca mulatta]MOV90344.1 immunoglobulin heavy chain junction region [Macaca mulatta]